MDENTKEITEKELNDIISESVSKEIEKATESMVKSFEEKLEAQRKNLSEKKEETEEAKSSTRDFLKAVYAGDDIKAKALTTSITDTPKAGYTIPTELMAEVLRFAEQYGVARREM